MLLLAIECGNPNDFYYYLLITLAEVSESDLLFDFTYYLFYILFFIFLHFFRSFLKVILNKNVQTNEYISS